MRKEIKYKLTLEFELSTLDDPIDPDVAVSLNRIFSDYRDGRYPFAYEMMVEGLQLCLKNATYQMCQKEMFAKYGNEMVTTEYGKTAKAVLEADKMFDAMRKSSASPYIYNEPKARIERCVSS